MNIDILPIKSGDMGYRGLSRLLSAEQFAVKKGFNQLLEMYYSYISCFEKSSDVKHIFFEILPFYSALIEKGVQCEIIVSDKEPINDFCGKEIEFLGLDIVNKFQESLLLAVAESYKGLSKYKELLNENILCKSIDDCVNVITDLKEFILSEYGREMETQYIYKVLC